MTNLRQSGTYDNSLAPPARARAAPSGDVREWGGQDADRKIESDLLFSDNTINNVSSSRHGLAPKTPNDATKYLNGTGAWSVPSGVPTGAILAFSAATAPSGYLLCDGAAVSRTTYAALFALIGASYGAGDGSTTFNVPDLRGRPPVGLGTHSDVNTLGNNDGVAVGSRTPKHTHTGPSHTHTGPSHTHDTQISGYGRDAVAETGRLRVDDGTGNGTADNVVATSASGTGATGAGGMGATGFANDGYLVIQFIIKT